MTVKYCIKVHDIAIHDNSGYFSDPDLDGVLAVAEKFFVTARVTNVSGTGPALWVGMDTSNDGVNWTSLSTLITNVSLSASPAVNSLSGCEKGLTGVVGRYVRVWTNLGGTTPAGQVEVWICGRSAI